MPLTGCASLLLVVLFAWINCPGPVQAKWVSGTVDDSDATWRFLTRFCFLTDKGTLSYHFMYPVAYGTEEILMYYDDPGQWGAIYNRGKTCDEMFSVLSLDSNQIIALNTSNTQTSSFSGCHLITHLGATWYNCTGDRSFRSTRERWWYIVIARCGQAKSQVSGLYIEYKIHMTNGDDVLHQEFSADEFYILPIDSMFLVVYLIIGIVTGICSVKLRNRQLFHTTYKLFLVSVFIWTAHLGFKVIAWSYYGLTGWEMNSVEVTGRCFREFSNVVFILMLILMAKGFTITRGILSRTSTTKIAIFMVVFTTLTVVLFIWEGRFFDPGKVLYYYESPPGYCLVTLRLVGWLWFMHAAIFTIKHLDKQTFFFIPFFTFYTVWFWAAPIIIIIAMCVMPKWSREKTVNAVEQLIGTMGHLFFLYLTRPSAANSNFPYHVRTSQIGNHGPVEAVLGDRNPYFISGRADFTGTGPNLELFMTSKNDDVVAESERMYPPLQGEFYRFSTDCQPPSYPEATSSGNAITVTLSPRQLELQLVPPPNRLPVVTSGLASMINSQAEMIPGRYVDTTYDVLPAIGIADHSHPPPGRKDNTWETDNDGSTRLSAIGFADRSDPPPGRKDNTWETDKDGSTMLSAISFADHSHPPPGRKDNTWEKDNDGSTRLTAIGFADHSHPPPGRKDNTWGTDNDGSTRPPSDYSHILGNAKGQRDGSIKPLRNKRLSQLPPLPPLNLNPSTSHSLDSNSSHLPPLVIANPSTSNSLDLNQSTLNASDPETPAISPVNSKTSPSTPLNPNASEFLSLEPSSSSVNSLNSSDPFSVSPANSNPSTSTTSHG